ncbi:MAG: DMT family transporter [Microcoleaceae cyanobacterium]
MVGFLIVILAACFFCAQNLIVRILFNSSAIFGVFETGGFVTPTLQNSFLLLFMRMAVVVPLMSALNPRLYSRTWQEIGQLKQTEYRPLLLRAIAGGGFMFLYLALLYVSIGLIPTGIALTLFFTYPIFTALFSWKLFGDRPTSFRWIIMGVILLGSFLTIPQGQSVESSINPVGIALGFASGIAHAFYVVNAQKSFETFHPVPFTWINFMVALVLSTLSLLIGWNAVDEINWIPLWMGGLFSALVTFVGHVLNNIGIRQIGATSAAMIGSTNPVLTVIVAWLIIQETLDSSQIAGVVLVTLSVALLSQERRFSKVSSKH